MKILMLSTEGDGLGVASKLVAEGHDVFMYIREPRFARAGEGIVKRISSWREGLRKAELIICDMVGWGHQEELLRSLGKPTISCSLVLEQAELDRARGMELFRSVGVEIPETFACKNAQEAQKIVKGQDWGLGWVIKPDGNIATSKTIVVRDQEEFSFALERIPASVSLIVQRIVDGIEISTEGWFNGRSFIVPFNHTFEEKCFLNDNLGPATGCMGNVVLARSSNRLTRATVEKLTPFLSVVGYRGPVDINCIVTKEKAYALEITARMGYDAVEALIEGLNEPLIDLFFETALGIKKKMEVTSDCMMAVRLSVPPWPHAKPTAENRGDIVLGLTPGVLKHVAITDLFKAKGEFFTAAGDGVLLKATSTGRPNGADPIGVNEARNRVYRTLSNIRIGGKQYRTDIGDRAIKDWKQLKEWGWVS